MSSAGKERGGGGGTSAFEMVLPGAGRASAAGNAKGASRQPSRIHYKMFKISAPQIPGAGRINKLCR